jgi:glucose/arabinose dehydrogenase
MLAARTVSQLFFISMFSAIGWAQAPVLQLQSITQSRITNPTFATHANDGSHRVFVLEQAGRILVVPSDHAAASVFLDLTDRVGTSTERGLLGLAFHPDFEENRRFFVDYTRKSDGAIVVAQYHASASNPKVADKDETVILTIAHPNAEHNGGMLEFGPDGLLYISVGDGGNANDPSNNAQNLNSLLGKILRIDINDPSGALYSSPPSNPFYGSDRARDEIYAFGFRNPWRFSFDSVTGELYVADVGQDAVEEIDVVEAGGNYGWRVYEGWHCTNLGPAPCISENYINPIYTYVHTGRGGRCSITGGYIYRGNKQTLPFGAYIFGDYCTGEILMFYRGEETLLLDTGKQLTSFGVDEEGEIYAVGGTVDRILNAGAPFTPTTSFQIAPGGGVSFDTLGTANQITVNHVQIHPNDDDTKPAGMALIESRNNGVLVNEAAVPATALISNARFYGEVSSSVDTGVAIANPDMANPATVLVGFTDSAGSDSEERLITIPPGGQLAAFLDQNPFNSPSNFSGSITLNSSIPVSIVALRGILNTRSDLLTTTLPVVDLESVSNTPAIVPHLAAGGGWTTEVLLVNPTDNLLSGTVHFFSSNGTEQVTTVDGMNISAAAFAIPARSSRKLRATGTETTLVGSFIVTPDAGQVAPSVAAIYAYEANGVMVSTMGSGAIPPARQLLVYTEIEGALGTVGSVQTGVAISNPSSETAEVDYALVRLDGSPSGIAGKLTIGPNGQRVSFVRELPGAAGLALPFKGVLRLSSAVPIAALAIRGRFNERGEFLVSATPPADPVLNTGSETFIPQVVDGGGYATEIVIYDLLKNGPVSGNIYFFDQSGLPVDPDLH